MDKKQAREKYRTLLNRAKELRCNPTDAEQLLWKALRKQQLNDYRFRRQRVVGPFIVDFICLERKLIIELEGWIHKQQQEYDADRENYLRDKAYTVIRFRNDEVENDLDQVIQRISAALG